ncbi:hypothetical protein [Mycobacterium sp. Lab-001]|uniref:hypothetical protein n=1 Tax=Mycobacterium sp. Lab-001 TaxID=3410136 RepID=UPI003D16CB59
MNADMQPGCGAALVDAEGVPFVKLMPVSRGNGHPPHQFIYRPALVKVPGGVTVVAVLIGAALLGAVGALIAIPVAAAPQPLVCELLFPTLDEA